MHASHSSFLLIHAFGSKYALLLYLKYTQTPEYHFQVSNVNISAHISQNRDKKEILEFLICFDCYCQIDVV